MSRKKGEDETMHAPHSVFLVDFTLDQSKNRLAPESQPPNQSILKASKPNKHNDRKRKTTQTTL
jgi:hypothetical protein